MRGKFIGVFAILAAAMLLSGADVVRGDLINDGAFAASPGQIGYNTSVLGWTPLGTEGPLGSGHSPVFLFPPTGGTVTGDSFLGNVSFYGNPASSSDNDFVAVAGDPTYAGGIEQTINGLTAGQEYILTFNWAGAQQAGFSGDTTEKWQVRLGAQTQSTSTVNTPSQSFLGWQTASMTFTATAASELLTFDGVGSPTGLQPWLLLDNPKLNAVLPAAPLPSSVLMSTLGLGLIGLSKIRRRAN
ncbi:MAG TPA: hypothetical protein VG733_02225 [Chthoniobacteraceae bacterium]|nr:hypothetical protein [Chthoniobacteraceae bacterium]